MQTTTILNGNRTIDANRDRLASASRIAPITSAPIAGYSHVLVPILHTANEAAALRLGAELAQTHKAQLSVLSVLPPPPIATSFHWLEAIERLHRSLENGQSANAHSTQEVQATEDPRSIALRRTKKLLRRELGDKAELATPHIIIHDGDPVMAVTRFAEDEDVDLIVLAGRERRRFLPVLPKRIRCLLRMTSRPVLFA